MTPRPVRGTVTAPPSKSYTHRALVAGFLTGRNYHVHHPNDSADTRATREGIRAWGASFELRRNGWSMSRESPRRSHFATAEVDCGSSGTSMRLLTALAAMRPAPTRFRGSLELARRPIAALLDALHHRGARILGPPRGRALPFTIRGPVRSGAYTIPANISSQFVSGLLFLLPTLAGGSRLRLTGPVVSTPYIDATLAVLRAHGIRADPTVNGFDVPGDQQYVGRQFFVPGDASSAAYFWVAAAISGGDVTVSSLDPRWPQADRVILSVLSRMGARVATRGRRVTVRGPIRRAFDVDVTSAPDLYPLLALLGAFAPGGTSRIRGGPHARWKESDRHLTGAALARAFGARVRPRAGGLEIRPGPRPASIHLAHLRDHRVVMSAAVGAIALGRPSRLGDAESVNKSYQGFWGALQSLGGELASDRAR
ncbi:MAG TPA: 3-phosphoshikimate 1-carboxyvinyltransferase [Thermoplasmata archaeon]|nr:3-phosphoshikimate 1-carboxyvinyltransferase [Thermoplasmata archaeon]